MASDTLHKQEFRIRELSTRSVLLFPTQAQIIRDIKDIALQPGQNQIVIDGLSPTVDEHSIKVEGTGAATINEVTVDLLPNRDAYEDIYPSDDEEGEDDDESESEDGEEPLKTIISKIKELNVGRLVEEEKINSAAKRLQICDNFGDSVAKERPLPDDLEKILGAYNDERGKIFKDHATGTAAVEKFREEIKKCEKEKTRLIKDLVKTREKEQKEKTKLKEKKLRKRADMYKEKQRIKTARQSFWPKKVYRITISLELSTMTPDSSRRNSIDGDTIVNANLASTTFHEPSKVTPGEISLSLSYITYSASWSPRYDLSLDSTKFTGVLDYGATLTNTTSETWRDAKVILSTSQTTFSGLNETIPTLFPWQVRLQKGQRNTDLALFSTYELSTKRSHWNNAIVQSQKPRHEIFGVDTVTQDYYRAAQAKAEIEKKSKQAAQVNSFLRKPAQSSAPGGVFGSSGLFGGASTHASNSATAGFRSSVGGGGGGLFGSSQSRQDVEHITEGGERVDSLQSELEDEPVVEDAAAPNSLIFEEGAWEETGLTTTYDVPGLKTLAPSNSTSKHKIAKITFMKVVFSHIIIGKLRQVAFLKARLRNSSKITLLKGPLGLTLDGAFLGRASFPRCSAGESFSLPLGIDPALQISYPKPTVRRSQSGIFSKEDSNVFTRTIIVINTKHNAPVELTVLDQVPVSEDERLKVDIVTPRGLKVDGERVRTGTSATDANTYIVTAPKPAAGTAKNARTSVYSAESGKELGREGAWGKAEAVAKKGGEVAWNVKLMPGCGVKLALEYELSFPGGEGVVGV
jgi:hypothetical protein